MNKKIEIFRDIDLHIQTEEDGNGLMVTIENRKIATSKAVLRHVSRKVVIHLLDKFLEVKRKFAERQNQ